MHVTNDVGIQQTIETIQENSKEDKSMEDANMDMVEETP